MKKIVTRTLMNEMENGTCLGKMIQGKIPPEQFPSRKLTPKKNASPQEDFPHESFL